MAGSQQRVEHTDVLVVGAGQAGLALGWQLQRRGISFVMLEAGPRVGDVWRQRWDSLRLFTPAEYNSLPGSTFPGSRWTYPGKDQVADYLADYAEEHALPVRLNAVVRRLWLEGETFHVEIGGEPAGSLTASNVVVATGPFQDPFIPEVAPGFGSDVLQLHSAQYRRPAQLPSGSVLVVGAGNSGLQIAAELGRTRSVSVAVGSRPPMLPQRLLGRDLFWWLTRLGLMDKPADSRLARRMRDRGDPVIGSRLSALRRRGVSIRPRLVSAAGATATYADGTTSKVAAVVWATGFRGDYSWLQVPAVLDDAGQPRHRGGITDVPGLTFLGLSWQRSRGSALLGFVQRDAHWLSDHLAGRLPAADVRPQVSR